MYLQINSSELTKSQVYRFQSQVFGSVCAKPNTQQISFAYCAAQYLIASKDSG